MKPTGRRELPIIFTTESVRGILAGAKTQTRRLMNPQPMPFAQQTPDRHPPKRAEPYLDAYCDQLKTVENPRGMGRSWHWWTRDDRPGGEQTRSRFLPGDVLWVKEAWRTEELDEMEEDTEFQPGTDGIRFRADGLFRPIENTQAASEAWLSAHIRGNPFVAARRPGNAWRSPLYMPRWASRIAREVTEVRAQRIQDISEEDAIAEGFSGSPTETPREQFAAAWDRINRRRSPWVRNDFVFAYTFRRIER